MVKTGGRTETTAEGLVTLHHHYVCDRCEKVADVTASYPEGERMPFHLQTGWPGPPPDWISVRVMATADDYWAPSGPLYCSWTCVSGLATDRIAEGA